MGADLGKAGNGDFELLIGGGCLAFQLVQFSITKDFPPVALRNLCLWFGNFPAVGRASVRSDNVRRSSVSRRNSRRLRAFVIGADRASGDQRQGGFGKEVNLFSGAFLTSSLKGGWILYPRAPFWLGGGKLPERF